jgi:hypothetical protein
LNGGARGRARTYERQWSSSGSIGALRDRLSALAVPTPDALIDLATRDDDE